MAGVLFALGAFCFVAMCACLLGAMSSPGFRKVLDGEQPTFDEEKRTVRWYWAVWFFAILLVMAVVAALAKGAG